MAGVNLGATVEAPAMDYLASLLPSSEIPTVRGQPDSTTQRRATPSFSAMAMDDAAPVTRRATDAEIKAAQDLANSSGSRSSPPPPTKASKPPIRLGGLSDLPPFTQGQLGEAETAAELDALDMALPVQTAADPSNVPNKEPAKARKPFDTKVHTRPTPPATRTPHISSLRFPEGSLRDARNRRKTTKVNVEAVRLAVEAATEGRTFSNATLELSTDAASLDEEAPFGDELAVEPASNPADGAEADLLDLNIDALDFVALDAVRPISVAPISPPPASPAPTSPSPVPNTSTAQTQPGIPATSGSAGLRKPGRPAAGIPTPLSTPAMDLFEESVRLEESSRAASETSAAAASTQERFDPEQTVVGLDAGEVGVEVNALEVELSAEEEDAISSEASFSGEWDATSVPPPPPVHAPEEATPELDDPALKPILARFERGDYFGALLRAEALLEDRPDFTAARRYVEEARDRLRQMYLEKLGSGEQILRVMMHPGDIQTLSLDHRAGFLISLIDGVATIDDVLDMSGMAALDVLRLLFEMREQGVVAVDGEGLGGGPNGP